MSATTAMGDQSSRHVTSPSQRRYTLFNTTCKGGNIVLQTEFALKELYSCVKYKIDMIVRVFPFFSKWYV